MLRPRANGNSFSLLLSKYCRVALVLLLLATAARSESDTRQSNVVVREQVSHEHRVDLANKLKKITGWPKLDFNGEGALQIGTGEPVGGSQTARDLITKVIKGPNFIVLEDASNQTDVVFCRVVLGRWKNGISDGPPAYVVMVDFADFDRVMGDRRALEAFDIGWGLLHELEHVASDSLDAENLEDTGECETHINQMRREIGLPERAEYFFTFFPLNPSSDFKTKFARLSFVEVVPLKKQKRYWLIWDADLVGGIPKKEQIASLR